MAYCAKCGAYIPDGQTACLACGYDSAAEQKAEAAQTGSQAAAVQRAPRRRSAGNEELRRRLEEQRQRSQEQNRQWAEQERQRRDEQAAREEARRRQQQEDRRWAEEEYQRRQEERRTRSNVEIGNDYRSAGGTAGEGNKALAALSYLSILFALPYIFTPQDEYAKFHAKQGLKLFIFGIVADIAASLIGIGWIATLVRLYLIYKGMSNALNGIRQPLPWIGEIGEK